jgi:DNA processing protein
MTKNQAGEERRARCLLHVMPGMGALRARRLLDHYGSIEKALEAPAEWAEIEDGPPFSTEKILEALCRAEENLAREERSLKKFGARLAVLGDADYPVLLNNLPDAPLALSVWGKGLAASPEAIGIVGTRRPTPYGRQAAERLARELAARHIIVVSGLARGVDTAAHQTVCDNGGVTWGVLGSGFGRLYPPENRRLMEKMAERGAVISEFSFDAAPERGHFPARNRLISGISAGIVVVEAAQASGALITARWAADQGREVFAVPGPIFSENSWGPHELLKAGAHPAANADDILQNVPMLAHRAKPAVAAAELPRAVDVIEKTVLDQLSWDAASFDFLSLKTGLAAQDLAAVLARLELEGFVKSMPGARFARHEKII